MWFTMAILKWWTFDICIECWAGEDEFSTDTKGTLAQWHQLP